MRFGCVTAEIGRISALAELGYDYAELSFRTLAPLEGDLAFAAVRDRVLSAGLPVEALSGFIPPFVGLKVVGPDVDRQQLRRYTETMLGRAAQIGAKVAVFGSGASRAVPDGFPRRKAIDQLRDFLAMAADLAAPRQLTIALEVLNREETNLVNTHDEALMLVREVNRPSLRTMADYYHILSDGRPLGAIQSAAGLLAHAHTSDEGRRPPGSAGTDQGAFLRALREAGYDGRLSIECRFQDFAREAPAGLEHLRNAWRLVSEG